MSPHTSGVIVETVAESPVIVTELSIRTVVVPSTFDAETPVRVIKLVVLNPNEPALAVACKTAGDHLDPAAATTLHTDTLAAPPLTE